MNMKILVLADIHANWPALAAIEAAETFDACLFLGDVVDYGTDPVSCVDWIREHADAAVRGNHDHAVAQRVPARGGNGFRLLAATTRPLQWAALDPSHLKFLARLPITQTLKLDRQTLYLVHATPRDPMDEYLMDDGEQWSERLDGIEAGLVCVGHSHIQFHLQLNRHQVLNPGSVGQPRDGDPRSAYAVIERGKVELRRVSYDIDATLRQMRNAGIHGDALDMTEAVLRSGGRVASTQQSGALNA
jgi:putative phosphoesterase